MPPINVYQFVILVVLALVLLGPERLPQYAQALARWTKRARHWADDAKVRFKDETGTDFDDVDWQKYDPRQYDPRRIIREALAEEMDDVAFPGASRTSPQRSGMPRSGRSKPVDPLELFGGGAQHRGAVAAGVAGAAAAGASTAADSSGQEDEDPLQSQRAPFDAEAT
ncbi:hypothetical protein [Nesterenkonia muleiensis]|uniref:hypothetical protein n=1 Tax=Nesterenkonia muleiensis TaxID=2282648 RepID=UPI000E7318CF|nr:hypothetical protein [Nesterenkonia muleiensis]